MLSNRISFYFFSEKIVLRDIDLNKKNGVKQLLDSKRNSIAKHISVRNKADITSDNPFYAFVQSQLDEYAYFKKTYNKFIKRSDGSKRNN